jgi:peptidoglycan/xylan/chitin deacetylase (PgdA/CDA1 family)
MPLHVWVRVGALVALGVAVAVALGLVWPPLAALPFALGLGAVWLFVPQAFPGSAFLRGRPDGDAAALTFDDGPNGEQTRAVLAALAREGVKATFFLLGESARRARGLRLVTLPELMGE